MTDLVTSKDCNLRIGTPKTWSGAAASILSKRIRVLWIDDEVCEADPLVRLLALNGVHVVCVKTAQEGIRAAERERFELILIDLRLPDISGLQVLSILSNSRPLVPKIVVSGYADVANTVWAMQHGAVSVKQKPLVSDELVALIHLHFSPSR